jgi:hypothetical protein
MEKGELRYWYLDTVEYTNEGLIEEDRIPYYLIHLVLKSKQFWQSGYQSRCNNYY